MNSEVLVSIYFSRIRKIASLATLLFNNLKKEQIMKTLAHLLIVACTLLLVACGSSKPAKATTYSQADELNEKIDQYIRDGWKIHGTSRTLRGKLIEHYDQMKANPDLYELIGTSTGCRTITVCRVAALNAACVELATRMGQDLKGKTMRDLGLDEAAETPTEYNKFQAACISNFQASIKEDMVEDFALIQSAGGVNNYEIYFLIEKDAASKKRKKAIEAALAESKLNQEYARSVEKSINEGKGMYE